MKKVSIVFLIFHYFISLNAQENSWLIDRYKGILVLDGSTFHPLDSVAVFSKGKQIFMTGKTGEFYPEKFGGEVVFCKEGYEDREYKIKSNTNNKIEFVFLEKRKVVLLDEVVLTPKEKGKRFLSKYPKAKGFFGLDLGTELAIYFSNPWGEPKKVNKIYLNVYKVRKETTVRLRFYSVDTKNNHPGEEIFLYNLLNQVNVGKKGSIEIDLSEYRIYLPHDGLFVSIEGVDVEAKDTGISYDKSYSFKFKSRQVADFIFFSRNVIRGVEWLNDNKFLKENYLISFGKEYSDKRLNIPDIDIEVLE